MHVLKLYPARVCLSKPAVGSTNCLNGLEGAEDDIAGLQFQLTAGQMAWLTGLQGPLITKILIESAGRSGANLVNIKNMSMQ